MSWLSVNFALIMSIKRNSDTVSYKKNEYE